MLVVSISIDVREDVNTVIKKKIALQLFIVCGMLFDVVCLLLSL